MVFYHDIFLVQYLLAVKTTVPKRPKVVQLAEKGDSLLFFVEY